jgi:ribosomal protein S18 acetylase RimI-like enzyme
MNDSSKKPEPPGGPATLRPAAPGDAEAIGVLLREAGGPVADPVFGFGEPEVTIRNMTRMARRKGGLFSWDITTVAEVDGRVVGTCSDLPGPEVRRRLRATIWSLFRVYGIIGTLRLSRRLSALRRGSPEVPEDDYQVVNVAVMPEFRNRGIGRALLERAHRAAAFTGAARCSLTVIIENADAQRLYHSLGYRPVDDCVDHALRQLTGVSGLRHMTRDISRDVS